MRIVLFDNVTIVGDVDGQVVTATHSIEGWSSMLATLSIPCAPHARVEAVLETSDDGVLWWTLGEVEGGCVPGVTRHVIEPMEDVPFGKHLRARPRVVGSHGQRSRVSLHLDSAPGA